MSQHGMIPFLDLATPHRELEEELVALFRDCIRSAHFVGGKIVEDFEKEFAQFCDTRFSVGLASGTDAVRFALMAAGVKDGARIRIRRGERDRQGAERDHRVLRRRRERATRRARVGQAPLRVKG